MDETVNIEDVLVNVKELVGLAVSDQIVATAILKTQVKSLRERVQGLLGQVSALSADLEKANEDTSGKPDKQI